ncbi:hypothetical protein Rumeso_04059 [Rubellimicrobium mesophilum DSM 19309]|uniref:Uncharacterized protein n=1 Tax=Rubellimicrobium mesophilum DSM 19309 TaxID=442562 RepID=A0A017HKQ9_9RHOB|nr:hypothetical protein [Rubellimicrobium mesophilum]EYD74374.1 hypothetical protein Rumeso_04059 [Rubellimicrobium mesophilum DSM 19309]
MRSLDLSPPVLEMMDDFADLFGSAPHSPRETLMAFGFSCGPGWLPLIQGCLANLRLIVEEDGLADLRVIQVKEKYGQLRIYASTGNDRVWELLQLAEAASGQICENCGGPSQVAWRGDWLTTLCPVCLLSPDVPEHWRDPDWGPEEGEGVSRVTLPVAPISAQALVQALGRLPPEMAVVIKGPWTNEHQPAGGVEVMRVAADPRRFRRVAAPHGGPGWDSREVAVIRPASSQDNGETP